MREICLDTETTGLDPKDGHRIIEIGCVEIVNGVITNKSFHCYVNPEREVPEEAFKIHGISTDFLLDKPKFSEIAKDLLDFIGSSKLVIHNASFDMKFLNHHLRACNLEIIERANVIDSLEIARRKFPGAGNSLDALCKRFSIDLSRRTKHGALLDSELLANVYIELMGGNQTSMFDIGLGTKKSDNAAVLSADATTNHKKREFALEEKDLNGHKEFILKHFKTNLWDY